ncbi:hypothetical protein VchM-138_0032 [Vibrio phage vB_VchM-138]|uniref:hypothetical protein n=1 Tax=Vibrio phage vB_VchM-138 TaxID=1127518 RepID=UPI0002536E0F|nr:hypothetical protein F397_gp32 [Vibrio phage vB_VchM-138]AFC22711.1 hypothetical protein VchM-138_0032 [Vibrio phage vB_VchM-138]
MVATREQALDWCVAHVAEWPVGYEPSISPDGWMWAFRLDGWILHNFQQNVITRSDFIRHKITVRRFPYVQQLGRALRVSSSVRITPIYPQSHHTPCGKSFSELIEELNK